MKHLFQLDFLNRRDSSGNKIKSQFTSYFNPILNSTDPHTKRLTNELIEEFINDEIIFDESSAHDNLDDSKEEKIKI